MGTLPMLTGMFGSYRIEPPGLVLLLLVVINAKDARSLGGPFVPLQFKVVGN
jgi:hypothetical protein